jgi:hypothetical protein
MSGLHSHREEVLRRPRYHRDYTTPVVLGATPWLTSHTVVETLGTMWSCVIIDKKYRSTPAVQRLAEHGEGVLLTTVGLEDGGLRDRDGKPQVIPPGPPEMPGDSYVLSSVRMIGYPKDPKNPQRSIPLMHHKLAVCAGAHLIDDDELGDIRTLKADKVRLGSANWTQAASNHLEFGVWVTDPAMCQHLLNYMRSLIEASERLRLRRRGLSPTWSQPSGTTRRLPNTWLTGSQMTMKMAEDRAIEQGIGRGGAGR